MRKNTMVRQMKDDVPEMLRNILDKGSVVTWADILAAVSMDEFKAERFLAFLTREGHLKKTGSGPSAEYVITDAGRKLLSMLDELSSTNETPADGPSAGPNQ